MTTLANAIRTMVFAAMFASLIGAAVAAPPSGTVREKQLIGPADKLAVIWNVGTFNEPKLNDALRQAGTLNWPYGVCTNWILEQTFKQNGYAATAVRVQTGIPPQ